MRQETKPWVVVVLVTAAIAISYFDRLTLPVAIAAIGRSIPISDAQFGTLQAAFLVSYALLYAGGGRLLDLAGTRTGFILIMVWWSLACAFHGLATGLAMLAAARLLLGMGEGGAYPAAIRVAAEWFPARQRSTAMGIINAGSAVGSLLAPPLIGLVLWLANWRVMFFLSGGLGLLWTVWWMAGYQPPVAAATALKAAPAPWRELLSSRRVLGLIAAKFLSDAAWYFFIFWLPKYLYDARGFDIKHVSLFAWVPYAASGVGSVLGGWLSSCLLERGNSLNFSRKIALGASATLLPFILLVTHAPVGVALLLFSIAFFGHQAWSTLLMTIPADVFPLRSVGSVAGLIGCGGALGGAVFNIAAGHLLSHGFGYGTVFAMAATFHPVAFAILLLTSGDLRAEATATSG